MIAMNLLGGYVTVVGCNHDSVMGNISSYVHNLSLFGDTIFRDINRALAVMNGSFRRPICTRITSLQVSLNFALCEPLQNLSPKSLRRYDILQ